VKEYHKYTMARVCFNTNYKNNTLERKWPAKIPAKQNYMLLKVPWLDIHPAVLVDKAAQTYILEGGPRNHSLIHFLIHASFFFYFCFFSQHVIGGLIIYGL
jgi:hypothetical protein